MKNYMQKGILYPVFLLVVVMTLLVSYTAKPSADAITHGDLQNNIFLLDTPTGLSSQTTYSILKDRNGFIWVSTRNGIDFYDGASFQRYKLGDTKMRGMRDGMNIFLYCDDEGDLWAFTERSLIYRYNKVADQFDLVLSLPEQKIWGSVQALYKHGEHLFCGATDGITCYNLTSQQVEKRFCPDDNIRTLIPYDEGRIFYGSQRGIGIINLEAKAGKLTEWTDTSVNSLYYDQQSDRLWVGGNGTGVYVIDPKNPTQQQFIEGTEGYVVSQICPFDKLMLVGVDGAGLWMASTDTLGYVSTFELLASDTPDAPHLLKSSSVRSVLTDGDNIWLALYIGGITHMQPPTPLLQLSNTNGKVPSDFFAQGVNADSEGNIWVAFEQSIACFDSEGEHPRYFLDHESHFLTVQPAQDGTVWCGGYNTGLYHFNPQNGWSEHFSSIVDQPVKDCIYCIKEASNGDIWVGGLNFPLTRMHRTANGAFDKKSYAGVTLVTDIDWLAPDSIVVGTSDGIYLIDTKTDSIRHMLNSEEEWNGTNYVSAIVPRNGHEIWAATQGAGIVCYDLNDKKNPIKAFGVDHGLPSLELRGMEMLNDSILCISTESHGIFVFDCARQCYLNSLQQSHGQQSSLFLQASSVRDCQNRIIFGGDRGAVVIKPSDMLSEQHNFDIFVVGKGLDNNKVALPFHARNLDIQFTTNDIYHQMEYSFYYRLQGISEEWQTIDDSRHVRFAQLPAGTYQLEIRAVGSGNQANSLTIEVNAEQEPWLRWYAIVGYILVIVLLTIIVLNLIQNRKRE